MRFVQIDILPSGKALVDIDKLTHAVPEGEGSRLFLGAQHLDVPHTLANWRMCWRGATAPTMASMAEPASGRSERDLRAPCPDRKPLQKSAVTLAMTRRPGSSV